MSGKLLGLLGGMSWESTAHYYAQINRRVRDARGGLHSAPLLLHSIDFAPLAELQRLLDWAQAAVLLGEAGRNLAQAGAGALLICSNTMHKVAAPWRRWPASRCCIADRPSPRCLRQGWPRRPARRFTMGRFHPSGRRRPGCRCCAAGGRTR
jgi:hypothetical protein